MTGRRVLFVHGLGSTFRHNWQETGWVEIMEDEGFDVVAFDLPGHGSDRVPERPGDTAVDRLLTAVEFTARPVDAVGFSVGCRVLLSAASRRQELFRSLTLLGAGDSLISGREPGLGPVADALDVDPLSLVGDLVPIRAMIDAVGNDASAVSAFARSVLPAPDWHELADLQMPVLAVRGDRDSVGPATRLVSSLKEARYVELRRTDHLATPTSPQAQEAVVRFLLGS